MKSNDSDAPVKVTYRNQGASVVARPSYYCEADPKVEKIRKAFLAGDLSREDAAVQVGRMVGADRFYRLAKEHGLDQTPSSIRSFLKWQEENPLECRLLGGVSTITAVVLARPGQTEVTVDV